MEKGDELVWSNLTTGHDNVLLFTKNGKSIRFSEESVRPMGRNTQGVRGIRLVLDDEVVGMDIIAKGDKPDLLTITEKGLGKKTSVEQFHKQSRGGQGVKVAQLTNKSGKIAASQIIPKGFKEVIITSKKGLVVKLSTDPIPRLSRATQGVILMRFSNPADTVASITCIE